jgi:hypothetical protein
MAGIGDTAGGKCQGGEAGAGGRRQGQGGRLGAGITVVIEPLSQIAINLANFHYDEMSSALHMATTQSFGGYVIQNATAVVMSLMSLMALITQWPVSNCC